jgi:hypothetical protein
MKSITKLLLAGAVVLAAIAISAAPSEAAKKKVAAKCDPFISCSVCAAKSKSCELKSCGADGKLYDNVVSRVCTQPDCPKKC